MSYPTTTCQQPADDLLYGFDIPDEDIKKFLGSLVASGQAPQAEINALRELSLMRGVEEWDMLFQCALALRAKHGEWNQPDDGSRGEASLVPFLDAVLQGQDAWSAGCTARDKKRKGIHKPGVARKRAPGNGVSHFWEEDGNTSETVGRRRRSQEDHSPSAPRCPGSCQDIHITEGIQDDKTDGDLGCVFVQEAQDIAPGFHSAEEEVSAATKEISSCLFTKESTTSDGADSEHLGAPRDTERAVRATGGSKSPFFGASTPTRASQSNAGPTPPSTRKKLRPPRGTVSSLPVPPLSADRFGLIQEELADDPFSLLIAVTFLIRTTGKAAIPVFRQLMERFPLPEALAAADPAEIITLIHPLGLSAVRCAAIQKYARLWLKKPPTREVRYGIKNYPQPGDGRHVRAGEEFGPEDGGVCALDAFDRVCPMVDAVADARDRAIGCAWEIGHLTQGPYALDSWRIFCRDELLGRSRHWTGKGSLPGFQPEWMRVLPRDKELRACLQWMWMREGWEWDPLTGNGPNLDLWSLNLYRDA
ncbi:DNA glycosylase [Parathielavia appendiculata]|uniref:DNA glycosylase n=1 Tax=Parathielavia appendiculata TaxID=2587402 RepID=A0AAN6U8B4_9PEZI|nr:DNA glycosylase [Parathielavia appendiculata]